MLKCFILISVVAIAAGQPQGYNNNARQNERFARVLRYDNNVNDGSGVYSYAYETENGIAADESGYLKLRGAEEPVQTVSGSYSYYSPEGQLIRVDYIADENGFQPKGAHLPTPPPIPEAIQKSLDIIYAGIARQQQQQQYNPNYKPDQGQYQPEKQQYRTSPRPYNNNYNRNQQPKRYYQ